MSRFWAGSDDESSDAGSDASSAESEAPKGKAANRWAAVSDSDSSDEGERVVRSAKDRAWDGMKAVVQKIHNSKKINDWNGVQTEFEALNKLVEKAKMHILKEGLPRFYPKTLAELEDFLALALKDKDAQRKMSATNGRALNRMKLQLRRHNKQYEKEIAAYRAAPDASEASASEASSDDDSSDDDSSDEASSDDDSSDASSEAPAKKERPQKALEDMDSDDWASSSDESESSSDDEAEAGGKLTGRARWLKSTVVTTKRVRKEKRVDPKKKEKKLEEAGARVGARGLVAALKLDAVATAADFDAKLLEAAAARGRKGTSPRELLQALEALADKARSSFGAPRELAALMHLVAASFDATARTIDDYMDPVTWRATHGHLARVGGVLEAHPQLVLGAIDDDDLADINLAGMMAKKKKGFSEEPEEEKPEAAAEAAPEDDCKVVKCVGNLLTYATRLEDEYITSLQHINPHTGEYVERLRDEAALEAVAATVQRYYVRAGDGRAAATVALMRVEHAYYKHESIAAAVRAAQAFRAAWGDARRDVHPASKGAAPGASDKTHPAAWLGAPTAATTSATSDVAELCRYVYTHGDDRCRTRALLCHVSHHALHGRFAEARDLLLMSHIQETAHAADVETQILHNRALVQLGLCAFRSGFIRDAHACLQEVCSSRVKELLAQGMQSARWSDKNPEQEKAERRRQTPYHMHVNLDLLECCHLTAAMLLEVPLLALEAARAARGQKAQASRPVSRHFRKYLDIFGRQVFTGPPENTRDHVLCAAKALEQGDWRRCAGLVLGLDVWDLIPGAGEAQRVKAMVEAKIKAEALRTYLFAYSPAYDALSLGRLCAMFELPKREAHGLVSKMMINRELRGAWDQPTETIVLSRLEPSPLQRVALLYADKAQLLVEANERLLDARAGGKGFRDEGRDWSQGGGRGWKGGDRSGGRGRDWGGGKGGYRKGGRGRGRGRGRGSNTAYVKSKNRERGDRSAASQRRW